MEDPAWRAVGPRSDRAMRRMLDRYYRGAIARALRYGGRVEAARDEGRVVGAAISYDSGSWPPPIHSFAYEAWGVLLAGPGPATRGLVADSRLEAAHPPEPHAFLHTLGVDPASQRRGAGAVLVASLIQRSDPAATPIHLSTAKPENLPYYRRFGFEVIDELRMPGGVPLWSMLHPLPPA
jgi:ribosomal protein S18 acetylase RimI-like enzyme